MALAKTVEHDTGVELNYWRITRVEIDGLLKSTSVVLSGYLSAEPRAAGKRPIHQHKFLWIGADSPVTPQIIMAGQAYQACYTKIKSETAKLGISNPTIFLGASDV